MAMMNHRSMCSHLAWVAGIGALCMLMGLIVFVDRYGSGPDAASNSTSSIVPVKAPAHDKGAVSPTRALIDQHCVKCHGPEKQQGKVRLDDLPLTITDQESAERWDDVLWVLEANEMPPKDQPPVDKRVRQAAIQSIQALLDAGLSEHTRYPHTPIRRMTRVQYNNAVVDLLGLKTELFELPEKMMRSHSNYFDPASGKMPGKVEVGSRPLGKSQLINRSALVGVSPFPQDLRAEHGFDNRADHLTMSPLLMEEFFRLSQSIVNSHNFGPKTAGRWNALFQPPTDEIAVPEEVGKRLETLLTRAFRRPVDEETLNRYRDHVLEQIRAGTSFTDAMKQAVSAVLASPNFLYLYEQQTTSPVEPVDDYELASRLSFFLWGSIPDQHLLDLAAEKRLSDPGELDKQIDRMLNDKKMKRFCDTFPAQWLQLEQIVAANPIGEAGKGFKFHAQYRASMHMMGEPLLLFEMIYLENRSLLELIDPKETYRSGMLKTWMTGGKPQDKSVGKIAFDRVPNTDRREGGVITNAAVLTMTSGPDHTKPITRGAWVATVIFNAPPAPPPADVPELPEKAAANEHLTLRERLKLHSTRQDCKSCHAKIDPYGFALENYDAAGRWRDIYHNNREIDSSGELFRTHKFSNPVEFKDAILLEKDRFVYAFAKHMLSYALGRETGVADSPALDHIAQTTAEDGYRMRTLIKAVATSASFLHKSDPEGALSRSSSD